MKKKTHFLRITSSLIFLGLFLFYVSSCKKNDDVQQPVPILTTTEVTEITQYTATSGGNITDDGGATVTSRGVCWSTHQNPTIDDNKTEDGIGAGSFSSSISDLELETTFYLRAYATNSAGTGYGSTMSFETLGSTFTDSRDGKVYNIVTIGDQIWMAENLAYVPLSGNYWAYDDNNANVETFGYLYDWQTALNVCPAGWHLPTDAEWTELSDYLGDNAGGKLKATSIWDFPNTGATNDTGFTALPGGYREFNGVFNSIGSHGGWWSATETPAVYSAWTRRVFSGHGSVNRAEFGKELGFSVRCLRD